MQKDNNDLSIFQKAKDLVPAVDYIAEQLKADSATSERLYKLMLIQRARIIELAEGISQSTMGFEDSLAALATQISNQASLLEQMDTLADKNAGARTVVGNLIVFAGEHEPSIGSLRIKDASIARGYRGNIKARGATPRAVVM